MSLPVDFSTFLQRCKYVQYKVVFIFNIFFKLYNIYQVGFDFFIFFNIWSFNCWCLIILCKVVMVIMDNPKVID